jgi:phage regulator Rha-like protein
MICNKTWHVDVKLIPRPNNNSVNKSNGEVNFMIRLENLIKSEYISNQARNIVRYFANINQEGFVFVTCKEIAEATDLARSTVLRHVNELKRKELIYVHKCTPYPNVYELTF